LTEAGRENALTVVILALAFAAASTRLLVENNGGLVITLLLAILCAAYNIHLVVRNYYRTVPVVIDTAGRWTCAAATLQDLKSNLDYYCEISREEHRKGPRPRVSVVDSQANYIVRKNEQGDVKVFFPQEKLGQASAEAPVKLSIAAEK
jgi:hypothetical protein